MPREPFPLSNGLSISNSKQYSNQKLENWYLDMAENGAFSDSALFGTEGIKLILNTGSGELNRGFIVVAEIPYIVNGTNLYKLNRSVDAGSGVETFTTTTLGTVAGTGFVSMATNGIELVIVVPGSTSYVYNRSTDVFAAITDVVFTTTLGPSNSVSYVDGFFTHTSSKADNEDTFFHSNLNQGLVYTATDFGSAAVDPDKIRVGHVHNNKFYALGSVVIEVFDNVGGDGFVFQRRDGFVIPKGVLANFSVHEYDGGFVFLGAGENEQPALWKLQGSTLSRLSTTTIQDQLADFTDTEIAAAFTWVSGVGGAYFINLTVGNSTFSYDSTASALAGKKIWHNKVSFINEAKVRNRVNSAVTAYGRVLVGDSVSGRIGELDRDTYTEYGTAINRVNTTQSLTNLNDEATLGEIELNIEAGVGDATTTDPQISLAISYDGVVFNNPRPRSMGKVGERSTRCIWNQNGMLTTQAVFEWTMSDPVKAVLRGLTVWVD